MFEKFYRRKPKVFRAIQYDGTDETKDIFLRDYPELKDEWCGLLAFIDYEKFEVTVGDWLLINKDHVVGVVRRDDFEEDYEPLK
jgi:hypothetical protein